METSSEYGEFPSGVIRLSVRASPNKSVGTIPPRSNVAIPITIEIGSLISK